MLPAGIALGFLPGLPLKMNCDPEAKRTQSINLSGGRWSMNGDGMVRGGWDGETDLRYGMRETWTLHGVGEAKTKLFA